MEPSADTTGRRQHPMPFTRLEIALLGVVDGVLSVLLARRAGKPFAGRWALPGGALLVREDVTLDAAAQRVARERVGTEVPFLRQVCAVGSQDRDRDRSEFALSIVYRALVDASSLDLKAGKRVEALAWRPVDAVRDDRALAFDHAELIGRAVDATRREIDALELPAGFIPETFTLGELQLICEQLLGRPLDKSSFRRRIDANHIVEPVEGEMRTGPNRPAQVYRLRLA